MHTKFVSHAISIALMFLIVFSVSAVAQSPSDQPNAARSVHLRWDGENATGIYNEVNVKQSQLNSYFCVIGFDQGYFGIQDIADSRQVIFSIWDADKSSDPNAKERDIKPEDRVQLLYHADDVKVERFGGEGTGGHGVFKYDWKENTNYRFYVSAKAGGGFTTYTSFFFLNETRNWKKILSFRVFTGGRLMGGFYSFIEDFRRDYKSAKELRRAFFKNGAARNASGTWTAFNQAYFTADNSASMNINAGFAGREFFLQNGDGTRMFTRPNTVIKLTDQTRTFSAGDLPE